MEIQEEDRLIIRENPFESETFDVVWKRREKYHTNEYRSRQKTTTVENKLKSYNGKVSSGNKQEDKSIDYSYIDEYCRVSAPVRPRDDETKPRELKTNTTEFGRPKVSFDKFVRHHIGGGGAERTVVLQPADVRSTTCQRVQDSVSYRNAEHRETTPLRECYSQEDVTFTCSGSNVETLVDYCTCMCCVKGLFYHCAGEESSCPDNVLDNPCLCSPVNTGCVARWGMMGLLSLFLPCLMCYPLARACTGVCKSYKEGESRRKNRQNRTVQNRERQRLT